MIFALLFILLRVSVFIPCAMLQILAPGTASSLLRTIAAVATYRIDVVGDLGNALHRRCKSLRMQDPSDAATLYSDMPQVFYDNLVRAAPLKVTVPNVVFFFKQKTAYEI